MNDDQNSELERRLAGRTLQVYLYLQKKKEPSGIREVQRDLGLSSPSVAEYQVEKLVEMGLAGRDSYARVYVTRKVKVKAMASYINFGRFTVPRLAFYASLFTGIAALYIVFNFNSLSAYAVAVPAGAAAIFWIEAWKLWKYRLLEKAAKKSGEKDYFWISLMPGLAALAVFMVGIFFLYYYIEPSRPAAESPLPVDPNAMPFPASPGSPVTKDDIPVADHGRAVELFWIGLSPMNLTMLLFAGALVAGFVLYVMVKYRGDKGVPTPEQHWN
ncbi:MAG TPA: hypothetical protein VGQ13_04425 [Nitrososphaera sp.]|nr:hypothetical protein [Nitrososphaera sp.]